MRDHKENYHPGRGRGLSALSPEDRQIWEDTRTAVGSAWDAERELGLLFATPGVAAARRAREAAMAAPSVESEEVRRWLQPSEAPAGETHDDACTTGW